MSRISSRLVYKLKETGSDKELFDLANNDRSAGDTRHPVILVAMVVTK